MKLNIEEIAKEAGLDLEDFIFTCSDPVWIATQDELKAFARLIVERCADMDFSLQLRFSHEEDNEISKAMRQLLEDK